MVINNFCHHFFILSFDYERQKGVLFIKMKFMKLLKKIWIVSVVLALSTTASYANIEDNSIEKELDKTKAEALDFDFSMQEFSSCKNMEDVMGEYVKDYWKNNYHHRYYDDMPFSVDESVVMDKSLSTTSVQKVWDYSKTNTQVSGVDESDIIKTDGNYIYYYNKTDSFVYIIDAKDKTSIVKKLSIPKHMYSPVLYIDNNRLVVVSSGYAKGKSDRTYYFNRWVKSYSIVFDTSDINNPVLIKLFVNDGSVQKTRKIWDYLYVLSESHFDFPYYRYDDIADVKLEWTSMLPQSIELTRNNDKVINVRGKNVPYSIKSWNMAECNEISYALPDKETIKKFDFSPSYNIISVINIRNEKEEVRQNVIAGSNSEIYMSTDNLYMTSNIYQANDFTCPPNRYCMRYWYPRGENTLIHKINIDKNQVTYQDSSIIPWKPLNQYSMDQHWDDFRIITQEFYPERQTSVYILDKNLKLKGRVWGLWKTEDFKSSRFMWDKLYLVTFKQIDPFYVVDLSDSTKPRVIGELKIPGYSTYLHPYDENHIIGLWYDTIENQWWGTMNGGVKVDLYEINFDKKVSEVCWKGEAKEQLECLKSSGIEVKNIEDAKNHMNFNNIFVRQKFTQTFGSKWSHSEALNNPRMFMWNSDKNTLLLPVKISGTDEKNYYKQTSVFQWLLALEIDKQNGIKQKYSVTHIDTSDAEEQRFKACEKYIPKEIETPCKTLINGQEYCPTKAKTYIPNYCFADSTINEYVAANYYQYRDSYVTRALWIWDKVFSISNDQIKTLDFDSWKELYSLKIK